MQCGVGTIKNLDSQLKGAKTKNRRLSKKLTKISAFAKEKQETLKQRETGGGGAGGAMAGTSEAGAQQTEMRELLEELQRTQEDVLALSSIASSGGEEEEEADLEDQGGAEEGRRPRFGDLPRGLEPGRAQASPGEEGGEGGFAEKEEVKIKIKVQVRPAARGRGRRANFLEMDGWIERSLLGSIDVNRCTTLFFFSHHLSPTLVSS